jgi:hypothetical protein
LYSSSQAELSNTAWAAGPPLLFGLRVDIGQASKQSGGLVGEQFEASPRRWGKLSSVIPFRTLGLLQCRIPPARIKVL